MCRKINNENCSNIFFFNWNLECRIKSSSKHTRRKKNSSIVRKVELKNFHVRFQWISSPMGLKQFKMSLLKILKLMFFLAPLIKFSFRDTIFHFQILIHKISIFLCDWNVSWIIDEISVERVQIVEFSHWNGKLWMFFYIKNDIKIFQLTFLWW